MTTVARKRSSTSRPGVCECGANLVAGACSNTTHEQDASIMRRVRAGEWDWNRIHPSQGSGRPLSSEGTGRPQGSPMTNVARRPVKLTAKERHALAELSKPAGQRDYARVHGRTIHALQRKGLFGNNGKPGGALTPAGRAALAVPDIFADLCAKEPAVVLKKQTQKPAVQESVDLRAIEFVETTLHDPVREGWEAGLDDGAVRIYCTSSPLTHGVANGRWALQVRARVKTRSGGTGKHFAIGTASMSREDLTWLRAQIDAALRSKS